MAAGSKCGPGALSAAFSKLVSPYTGATNPVVGTIISAVVGGTASVLGGGKFANGAKTAAYGYIFNNLGHNGRAPYDRHEAAVDRIADQLKVEGYEVVGYDVKVTVATLSYERRYDLVVFDRDRNRYFGVEVKTSLGEDLVFKNVQAEFDIQTIAVGANGPAIPAPIFGVIYRGESALGALAGVWRTYKLYEALVDRGVIFYPTNPPRKGR